MKMFLGTPRERNRIKRAIRSQKRRQSGLIASITVNIDMRLSHGVKIPADATGITSTYCRRIGLILYHAKSLHVNVKPLRGDYLSARQMS